VKDENMSEQENTEDTGKVFTQKELDEIVEKRLAKQRAKHEADVESKEAELKALRAEQATQKQALEDAVKQDIEAMKAEIDPAILQLFPEELSLEKQLAWLKKAKGDNPVIKGKTPRTPKPVGNDKGDFKPTPPTKRLF
jgi:septal ring factor EnvC (AmiA/AmiB activator)